MILVETRKSRIRDLSSYSHDEQDPSFRIFDGLVFPEMVFLDSLPVLGDPLYANYAFVLGKEFDCRGEIGEYEERDNALCDGDGAEDYEDVLTFL
jgi:hypothetical protein